MIKFEERDNQDFFINMISETRPFPTELKLKDQPDPVNWIKSARNSYLTWLQRRAVNQILSHFLLDETHLKPESKAFLLADDTGLGKTRINLSVADFVARNVGGAVLLIVPNGEVHRKTLGEAAILGIGATDYLSALKSEDSIENKDVQGIFLVRISIFSQPFKRFPDLYSRKWTLIVFDESHMMKPLRNSWIVTSAQSSLPIDPGDDVNSLNNKLQKMIQSQTKRLESTGRLIGGSDFAKKNGPGTTKMAAKESMRRINLALLIDEVHVLFSSATPFERLLESELLLSKFFSETELPDRLKNLSQTIDFLREKGAIISRVLPFWGSIEIVPHPFQNLQNPPSTSNINNPTTQPTPSTETNNINFENNNDFYRIPDVSTPNLQNEIDFLMKSVRNAFDEAVNNNQTRVGRIVPLLTRLTFETELVEFLKAPHVSLYVMNKVVIEKKPIKFILVTEFVQSEKFLIPIVLPAPLPDANINNINQNQTLSTNDVDLNLEKINSSIVAAAEYIIRMFTGKSNYVMSNSVRQQITIGLLESSNGAFLQVPSAATFFSVVFPNDTIVRLFNINSAQNLQRAVRAFNTEENRKILIMTTRTGGTGIDLDDQTGEFKREMIVLTFNWSAATFHQLFGRISRLMTKSPSKIFLLWWSLVELSAVAIHNDLINISNDLDTQISTILGRTNASVSNPNTMQTDIERRRLAKVLQKVISLSQIRPDIAWTDQSPIDVTRLQNAPLDVFRSFVARSLAPTQTNRPNDPRFRLIKYNSAAFWMIDDPEWQQIDLQQRIIS